MEINTKVIENKQIRTRKLGAYKYPEGSLQHSKDTGYNKNYYQKNKVEIRCLLCSLPVLSICLKKHQMSPRCIKYRNCNDTIAPCP